MIAARAPRTATRTLPRGWRPYAARRAYGCLNHRQYSSHKERQSKSEQSQEPPDHRKLGVQQQLFMNSIYSPGSPIFLPNGAKIFNKLVDFLRGQYVRYGFEEVITPTIYKKSLWAKSGHLENYKENMYSVTGYANKGSESSCCGGDAAKDASPELEEDGEYGLKPMNCPGHCLIFASQLRSYRDLPIRYADFSSLHRNEISGALSGLTRVRRFHQDDGHIFCRPIQVEEEIKKTLDFVRVVYSVLNLGADFRLALSTRPEEHFIGSEEEWARAEKSLEKALDASGLPWTLNPGDGAFYGPKIDIVIKDTDGKEHQTATIQLDFQLPKRFELEYQAPAPEYEARGEETTDAGLLESYGPVQPVMIHRAVLGSVERLMALLIEKYNGKWPFWLNPRQAIVLQVTTSESVHDWAQHVRNVLLGNDNANEYENLKAGNGVSTPLRLTGLSVDIDSSAQSLGKKIRDAKAAGYGAILVVGDADVKNQSVTFDKQSMAPADVRDQLRNMVDTFA